MQNFVLFLFLPLPLPYRLLFFYFKCLRPQVHFAQPRPYAGADSDNLFASLSADELVDVAEYGAVTIMPVRLYLKEATWCVFDRFSSATTTTTAGDAAEDALRTLFVGKVCFSNVDYVSPFNIIAFVCRMLLQLLLPFPNLFIFGILSDLCMLLLIVCIAELRNRRQSLDRMRAAGLDGRRLCLGARQKPVGEISLSRAVFRHV